MRVTPIRHSKATGKCRVGVSFSQTCVQYGLIQAEVLLEYALQEPIKIRFMGVDCKRCCATSTAYWTIWIGIVRVADVEELLDLLPHRLALAFGREFAIFDPVDQCKCSVSLQR